MKKFSKGALASVVFALALVGAPAKAQELPWAPRNSGESYREMLVQQQQRRKRIWDETTIEWPKERYKVTQEVDGLPGIGYETSRIMGFLKPDCKPSQAIDEIGRLRSVSLGREEHERITDYSVRHQFVVSFDVADGYDVQQALDELWDCACIDYASPSHIGEVCDNYRRGSTDNNEPYSTYINEEEAKEVNRLHNEGKISDAEWLSYDFDNSILVMPGNKRIIDDATRRLIGFAYKENTVEVYIESESDLDSVASALSELKTSKMPEDMDKDALQEAIVSIGSVEMELRDGFGYQEAIDELWELPFAAYADLVAQGMTPEDAVKYLEQHPDPRGSVATDEAKDQTTKTEAKSGASGDETNQDRVVDNADELPTDGAVEQAQSGEATYTPTVYVNDPSLGSQWWLAAVDANNAWNIATAEGNVSIAALDTGFDITHEDLVGCWVQHMSIMP